LLTGYAILNNRNDLENTEENCEMIWKIWMKCEMIWKIWKKSKLQREKIWKIWNKEYKRGNQCLIIQRNW
jgi:hypothetical protein